MAISLSKAAQKLLAYLGIYKISATTYNARISGTPQYEYLYNVNWFADDFGGKGDTGKPRIMGSPKRGVFKTSLAELVQYGY
jgi:hypothetical protein